jgi:hypothetical protein
MTSGQFYDYVQHEPRQAEYFFDDEGQAIAFRRFHNPGASFSPFHYYTVFPNPELNTYYRFHTQSDNEGIHHIPVNGEATPQIWFGRLFTDHGATKTQDELSKNLGSLTYRANHLQHVSLGHLFVNGKAEELPALGQPYLRARANGPQLHTEGFDLKLSSDPENPTLQKLGTSEYTISDNEGRPIFYIHYWESDGVLNVEQRHLESGFRKLIRAKFEIDTLEAARLITTAIDPEDDFYHSVDKWLEMARIVGSSLSLGQAYLRKVFGD